MIGHDQLYLLKLQNIQNCLKTANDWIEYVKKDAANNPDPNFDKISELIKDIYFLVGSYNAKNPDNFN